jgi:hypothetical protein
LILATELNLAGTSFRMFSTVTTLATSNDVTLQALHIEAFYPADPQTEALLSFPSWGLRAELTSPESAF